MANHYTDIALIQNDVNTNNDGKRVDAIKVTGNMNCAVVTFSCAADVVVAGEVLRLVKLPPKTIIHPHLCRWSTSVLLDSAAVNLAIGDDSEWTHITPDPDRYMVEVDVVDAGDSFQWAPDGAATTSPAGATTPYVTTKEGWVDATLGTVTTPLNSTGVITFWVYYSVLS